MRKRNEPLRHNVESYGVGTSSSSNLETRSLRSGEEYIQGHVTTPYGFVEVLASVLADSRGTCYVRLDFVWKRRQWISYRERLKPLTKRGLARVAASFARRVATVNSK